MTIYSYSRLKCYEQCPYKYKLQYIDKVKIEVNESIEIFLGKIVHETLNKIYCDIQHQKLNSIIELINYLRHRWAKSWNDLIVIIKKKYTPDDYLKMAEQYIINYYNRYKPFDQGRTIAVEKRILISLDGSGEYKLCGYIDRVTKTKDGYYHIHDYKTCSRLPSLGYFQNDWQLQLYAIALKGRYPYIKNVCLVWHFLRFDKEIKSKITLEELKELKSDIIELIDTIETTEEFPVKTSRLCSWCKFNLICR
jgi:putative RecB family exonuclease